MIEEDRWIYLFNQEVIYVNGWYFGELNGYMGENCVVLWQLLYGRWVDVGCGVVFRFVCEVDFE